MGLDNDGSFFLGGGGGWGGTVVKLLNMGYYTLYEEQDARVREPGLLLVHKMIERREEMCTMQ